MVRKTSDNDNDAELTEILNLITELGEAFCDRGFRTDNITIGYALATIASFSALTTGMEKPKRLEGLNLLLDDMRAQFDRITDELDA